MTSQSSSIAGLIEPIGLSNYNNLISSCLFWIICRLRRRWTQIGLLPAMGKSIQGMIKFFLEKVNIVDNLKRLGTACSGRRGRCCCTWINWKGQRPVAFWKAWKLLPGAREAA